MCGPHCLDLISGYQLTGMKHVDMRKLPAAAQEERRRQVIGLRQARPDLWGDRGAGRAEPDRGVRHLQALCRAGRGRAEEQAARAASRTTAAC